MFSNPFATRFIAPGAIPFLFRDGQSPHSLVERLAAHKWQGQILGPHGSGKSTLLAALVPAIESAGRRVVSVSLHGGQRQIPRDALASIDPQSLVIVDGYEQLGWWGRQRLNAAARKSGAGLFVTAHADVGFPTIYETKPSEAILCQVVARLLADAPVQLDPEDVSRAYAASGGNIRETLFVLYDRFDERRQQAIVGGELKQG